ncbi:tetratricopeptide repeat protein [Saccharopolyspora pogona]|uniref:tetratricopeptide repeat protein n=1 Tax=Saccharopolyspora pogona TaxID=333966 RepID=UPI0016841E74|nr:hypothetical protein [Saccharopolyspora pogona]
MRNAKLRKLFGKYLDQALWHAQRARDLEPDSALTHCVIGIVLLSIGGRAAARQAREPLEVALRLDPQLPGVWNCLGLSALRTGRFVAALRAFITTLQLDPRSDNGSHNSRWRCGRWSPAGAGGSSAC